MRSAVMKKTEYKVRFFQVEEILLCVIALMLLAYVWFAASQQGIGMFDLIQKDVGYNIFYMYAMIEIVCLGECFYLKKQFVDPEHTARNIFQCMLVMFTQSFLMNPITAIAMALFIFFTLRNNAVTLRQLWKQLRDKKDGKYVLYNALCLFVFVSVIYMTLFTLVS